MTALGKILRKLRIDCGEVLYDMATKLGVSSSYLSAVENGKKPAPDHLVQNIVTLYDLSAQQEKELYSAASEDVKQVRINVGNASGGQRNLALAFARRFEDLDKDEIKQVLSILEKKRSRGDE